MAAKLYYGSGSCTIEGKVIAVELRFTGNIKIADKTSDKFLLMNQGNGIIIFPVKQDTGYLNNLFNYEGELKITSAISVNENTEKVSTTIHRVMDYTELLAGNTEDMTILTEKMDATYTSGNKITKTTSNSKHWDNLNTGDIEGKLYLKSGLEYVGAFNVSLVDNSAKTGNIRTPSSEDLFIRVNNKMLPTRNPSLVPLAATTHAKTSNMTRLKSKARLKKFKRKLQRNKK